LTNFTLTMSAAVGVPGGIYMNATRIDALAVAVVASRLINQDVRFMQIENTEMARNVSLSITDSALSVRDLLPLFWSLDGAMNISGLVVLVLRTNISTGWVLYMDHVGILSSLLLTVVDASVTAAGELFGVNGRSSVLRNASILVSGTKLQCNQLLVSQITSLGSVEGLSFVVDAAASVNSTYGFVLRNLAASWKATNVTLVIRGGSSLSIGSIYHLFWLVNFAFVGDVAVHVLSGSSVHAGFLLTVEKCRELANVDVNLARCSVNASGTFLTILNIEAMLSDAAVSLTCDDSTFLLGPSLYGASAFLDCRNVTSLASRVSLVATNCTFDTHPAVRDVFASTTVFLMGALTLLRGGDLSALITGSSISLVQSRTFFTFGTLFAVTAVSSLSAGRVSFRMVNRSTLRLTCGLACAVLSVQQSPMLSIALTISESTVTLDSTPVTVSTFGGSAVVTFMNSAMQGFTVSIANSSIRCGQVCRQLVASTAPSDLLYDFFINLAIGFLPPPVSPMDTNMTVFIRNVSLGHPGPIFSGRLVFPMLSFANSTNTTVVIEGPVEADAGLYDGMLGSSPRSPTAASGNRLELLNCEAIVFRDAVSGAQHDAAAQLLPRGARYAEAPFRSWRSANRSGGPCVATATLSVSRGVSHTPATPSFSIRLAASGPSPRLQLLGGAIVTVGLASGTAGASGLQILHAQGAVASCGNGDDGEEPIDVASSPLQLRVGEGAGSYSRGAVVGNASMLAACCVLALLVLLVLKSRNCGAADAKLPGLLFVPWSVLAVPTLTAATVCFATATSDGSSGGSSIVVGLVGTLVVLVPMAALVVVSTVGFEARAYRVPLKCSRVPPVRLLQVWYGSTCEYEDKSNGFVDRWEFAGVTDFSVAKHRFAIAEPLLGIFTGVLAGLTSLGGPSLCRALNALQTLASVGFFALLVLMRPQNSRADRLHAVISSCLQCGTAFLGLVGRDVSFAASVAQLVVTGVHLIGYGLWGMLDGAARCLWLVRGHRRAQRRQRQQRRHQRRLAAATRLSCEELAALEELGQTAQLGGAAGEAAAKLALQMLVEAASKDVRCIMTSTAA
jgi:hypothetical protein